MKRTVLAVVVACLNLATAQAQPMSGSYTVGGPSPDFAAPHNVAIALKTRGVSGPTFFNVRPGVYTRDGGTSPVLSLDTVIVGLSAGNRITFQSDAASGGNVDNVAFEIDFIDPFNGTSALVWVRIPFVSFRNITFRDVDSLQAGAVFLLRGATGPSNIAPRELVVEGCRFVGNPYIRGSAQFGTDYGVYVPAQLSRDVTIRNCSFTRLRRAIEIGGFNATTAGKVIVEDNDFTLPHSGYSGSGGALGAQINANGDTVVIRRNFIDLANGNGGFHGIYTTLGYTGVVEQNFVKNRQPRDNGGIPEFFVAIAVRDLSFREADSVLVANNMVSGNVSASGTLRGLDIQVPRAKVFHNTVVTPLSSPSAISLTVYGSNSTVMNNIIQIHGTGGFLPQRLIFDYGNQNISPGLTSNYNAMAVASPVGPVIIHNAVSYTSLGAWQTASGQDTNSFEKGIDFIHPDTDPHLTDCQAQDPDLRGIPLADVPIDYDGDIRSTIVPMIGADEAGVRSVPMFGSEFRIPIPGYIGDIAVGRFDNPLVDGLAVADYDNQQVRLYHNNSSSRSFTLSSVLSIGFRPNSLKLFDLDNDGNLDVVVGGDTSLLRVYWGDGTGGFPSDTTIRVHIFHQPTQTTVVALDTGRVSGIGNTILVSSGLTTMPVTNFLGYLDNTGGRSNIGYYIVQRPATLPAPDSIPGILRDIVSGDIDGNGDPEVAALLVSGGLTDFIAFNDTNAQGGGGFLRFGTRYNYGVGAYGYMPTAGLVAGRFDADADIDFIVTSEATSRLMFLRNQGNFTFAIDTIGVNSAFGVAALDYDNDGDLDLITANRFLHDNGVTVMLNDGAGNFRTEFSCTPGFASGTPRAIVTSDFDLDGRTDVAVGGLMVGDSVFVLYNFGGGITSAGGGNVSVAPPDYRLFQNYPNPFNPSTTIRVGLPEQSFVTLKVYNILGQEVATLLNGIHDAGFTTVRFDAGGMASGVYFYRIEARPEGGGAAYNRTMKMVLLR